jgi:hypothetical protein
LEFWDVVFIGIGFLFLKRDNIPGPTRLPGERSWATGTGVFHTPALRFCLSAVYILSNCYIIILTALPPYQNPDGSTREIKGWVYPATVGSTILAGSLYYWVASSSHKPSVAWVAGQRIHRLFRPTQLPQGFARIEWTCRCGHSDFDEYQELITGGVLELANDLLKGNAVVRANATTKAASIMNGWFRSTKNITWKLIRGLMSSPNNSILPTRQDTTSTACDAKNYLKESDPRYLLFCTDSKSARKVPTYEHIDVRNTKSDYELFSLLQLKYSQRLGKVRKSNLRLKNIHFVEVS